MAHEVETMFSAAGEVPWHGLGNVIEDKGVKSAEALDLAGLNWDVSLEPIAQHMGEGDDGEDVWETIDGAYSVQRDTDLRSLGIVGERYQPLQNRDAFLFGDDLLDSSGAHWTTAGALKGGSVVWMLAELPDQVYIAGDEDEAIQPYILVSNSHDGSTAVTAAVTPVRVVCNNTLTCALKGTKRAFKVRHTKMMGGRISEAKRALGITHGYLKELKKVGDSLINEPMDAVEFDRFMEHLAPTEGKEGRGLTVMQKKQDEIKTIYHNTDNLQNIKGTRWGALQAVIDYNDHSIPGRGENQDEKRMHRILNLPNITHDAFKYLTTA
jgi:phage/plasmid-like protein (TIGR03299 family)